MADLFKDIIPSILQTKRPVITEGNEGDYVPFVVNKALSFHQDCILRANEMNRFPSTDRLLQYHYLINSIRGYKRPFQRWQKKEIIENIEAIKQYYNFSEDKAKEALLILKEDQIDIIKKSLEKGGIKKKKHK